MVYTTSPNKVKTAVQWFYMSLAVVARFSGQSNSTRGKGINPTILPMGK